MYAVKLIGSKSIEKISQNYVVKRGLSIMTRRASHPQYTMGILGSRILDKGPGVQVGWVMTLWGVAVDVGRLRNPSCQN